MRLMHATAAATAAVSFAAAGLAVAAVRLVVAATQTGGLLGIPATNRTVRWDAVDIFRIDRAGRIAEEWAADDLAAVASQLGAIKLPWASR